MECGIIIEMYADGYERVAVVKCSGEIKNVHFIEFDEYLECNEVSAKRKIGDELRGDLFIDLVCADRLSTGRLTYSQPEKLPHINAVVEAVELIDDYSIYAVSAISKDKVRVEFEHIINYNVGDRIYVEGELGLEI